MLAWWLVNNNKLSPSTDLDRPNRTTRQAERHPCIPPAQHHTPGNAATASSRMGPPSNSGCRPRRRRFLPGCSFDGCCTCPLEFPPLSDWSWGRDGEDEKGDEGEEEEDRGLLLLLL